MKKRIVIALGHRALGTTLPEQKKAVKTSAAVLADMVEEGYQLVITHSNAPQVGMIHTAMNEFGKTHPDYTVAPMSAWQVHPMRSSSDLTFVRMQLQRQQQSVKVWT